ncbi:MAG: DUF4433 domain-containing protein [Thiomargarita sp.]|nr:DUF4433 domain-containing protein [Thiomargarita sp.]
MSSIIQNDCLWCDIEMQKRPKLGTKIGMEDIKSRRRSILLKSHPALYVGACVPFYFCPRSIMLYLISRANHPKLSYCDGQIPIVHLECDLYTVVKWANENNQRWAFTLSNAGSRYFEDRCDLRQLDQINWDAVQSKWFQDKKEGKQAEFLVEQRFPWDLVERIGVLKKEIYMEAAHALTVNRKKAKTKIEIKTEWYYD